MTNNETKKSSFDAPTPDEAGNDGMNAKRLKLSSGELTYGVGIGWGVDWMGRVGIIIALDRQNQFVVVEFSDGV